MQLLGSLADISNEKGNLFRRMSSCKVIMSAYILNEKSCFNVLKEKATNLELIFETDRNFQIENK